MANVFEGKYVRIVYIDALAGTVIITRKSNGQEFPVEAGDMADWIRQMVHERHVLAFAGSLRRGHT